ncbi:APC family permease [Galbitalea soli]|uniref:APC family permease n=1 Tax=Galbitalea soli TaxID=1268042 RepID=A0A7C9PNX1_9MICO|nr:APC family permease [Galbitalea soli]NEM91973.1 APC family permease [Galbitalea soli]NYJ32077.1 amino acid transporter [Galbitalea soli]
MSQSTVAPEPTTTGAPARRLRGSLGVASIVFIVVAAASPLGVIGGPVPIGIAFGNGSGFPFTYVIATVVLLFFAVGFTAATPFVRSAGAFYAYVDKGLGRGPGIGAAFVALFSYIALEAGVFGLFGPGLNGLLTSWGLPQGQWWIYALIGLVVVGTLGYFSIEVSGRVLAVLLIAEVLIVLAFDAVVVFRGGGPQGFSTGIFDPSQIVSGAPGFGILFAILSFIGFEATAIFRDEAKDPDRTIPRATYISLILIGIFYAVSSWALISANGQKNIVTIASKNLGGLLSDTTTRYLGLAGGHIIQVLFVTSLFACILSFHNIVSRYLFSLAKNRVLPHGLSLPHPRFGSPARASVTTTIIVLVLIVAAVALRLDPIAQFYTWLGGISSVGIVLLLALTSVSVIRLFRKSDHGLSSWKTWIAPGVGLLGLAFFLFLILQNLPALLVENGGAPWAYGAFSWGVLAILVLAFVAGPVIAAIKKDVEVE